MSVLDGDGYRRWKGAVLGVNVGRSCAEVRELIELSFGVVSGVGPGIDVRNEGPRGSRERGGF